MTRIAIKDIRQDGGTQPREALDMDVVRDYSEAMQAGAKFPPVEIVYDGANNWLVDGFHRVAAMKQAGFQKIEANVEQGTQADAQWRSFGVNGKHGLRRSTRDKQRAIKAALKHPNGASKSDSQIAEHVGVDHKTVAKIRSELIASWEIPKIEKREATRNGTTYEVSTAKIGKTPALPTVEEIKEAVEQVKNIPAPKIEEKISAGVDESISPVTTRYFSGLRASCWKCKEQFQRTQNIYTNWQRDENVRQVVWIGPCGHRVSDALMRIEDEFDALTIQAWSYLEISEKQPEIPAVGKIPEKFSVILADPAWKYDQRQFTPYEGMDTKEIAALDVGALAADDCALFMWATWPMLREALNVGMAWGFEYSGCAFLWAKQVPSGKEILPVGADENWFFGQGWDGTRGNTEMCLLFLKGKPKRLNADVRQLLVAPVGEHSKKPVEAYERIEKLFAGPYLELFAREKRAGWLVWGNEVQPDISVSGK